MIVVLLLFVAYPCHVAGINSRKSVAFESSIRDIRASPINSGIVVTFLLVLRYTALTTVKSLCSIAFRYAGWC